MKKFHTLMIVAGSLVAAYTSTSVLAMGNKPVVATGTDTISRAEYDAVAAQNAALNQCLGDRWLAVKASGDLVKIEQALVTMGSITGARLEGPASVSRTQWNEQKAVFDAELARLKAKYGC